MIGSLKNNKAPDSFGVTSEHFKLASPIMVPLMTEVVNRILQAGQLPVNTKSGQATPIPKKGHQVLPDKFRRITITAMIGKLAEKQMVLSSDEPLTESQSMNQFGFTKEVSCNLAAMLLTESILHCKDTKQPIYITYMDAAKAFDVVDHDYALTQLYNQANTHAN